MSGPSPDPDDRAVSGPSRFERSLDALGRDVEAAAQAPVPERLAAFEAVNAALASELAQLDEL